MATLPVAALCGEDLEKFAATGFSRMNGIRTSSLVGDLVLMRHECRKMDRSESPRSVRRPQRAVRHRDRCQTATCGRDTIIVSPSLNS